MERRNAILRCVNVHKSFSISPGKGPELEVLKGIDLEVYEGEILSIVGASGSGKSTLLHILSGLDRPSGGEVYWHDREISSLDETSLSALRSTEIGFVFQFHHLLPEFTAMENVMIPGLIRGRSFREAEARARELLQKVDLLERAEHKPAELSGGEQQRIAVARALANKPRVVLADEPTGNLDSVNSSRLYELLLSLNLDYRQAFLIVTHNERISEQSHRVLRMIDRKLQPSAAGF